MISAATRIEISQASYEEGSQVSKGHKGNLQVPVGGLETCVEI